MRPLVLTVPLVGQRVRCVRTEDSHLGVSIIEDKHTGRVSEVSRLPGGGFNIEVELDQPNNDDGKDAPEDWYWGWNDEDQTTLHPNGFVMPALLAFHFHFEFVGSVDDNYPRTSDFV